MTGEEHGGTGAEIEHAIGRLESDALDQRTHERRADAVTMLGIEPRCLPIRPRGVVGGCGHLRWDPTTDELDARQQRPASITMELPSGPRGRARASR